MPYYIESYDGLQLEKRQDYVGALAHFRVVLVMLGKLQEQYPTWEPEMMTKTLNGYRDKIAALEPLAAKQVQGRSKETMSLDLPDISSPVDDLTESDAWMAMNKVEEYLTTLEILHKQNPEWQNQLVADRIKQSEAVIGQLQTQAVKKAKENADAQKGRPYQD